MADIVCPLCGTTYEGLNLDETNGWFICTKYDIDLCPMFVFDEKVKLDGAILQSKFEEALLGKLEPNV